MSSATPSDRPSRPPKEEPDFVNEADIPSADDEPRRDRRPDKDGAPKNADVAGVDSTAGEEDPGAALDTPPTPSPTRRPA
jgi:hypothetical protein